MKGSILLVWLTVGLFTLSFAQQTTLKFTADKNEQHVVMSSIHVENLTQGGDTTLIAPDTVLVLEEYVGIAEEIINRSFTVSACFPNPIVEKGQVNLHLSESKKLQLTVSDVNGRVHLKEHYDLQKGEHSFSFFPGSERLYLLRVQTDEDCQTIKIFNGSDLAGTCSLAHNIDLVPRSNLKSVDNITSFIYNSGDKLKVTASSNLGNRTITCTPQNDQTYYFSYTGNTCPGVPTVTDFEGNTYNTVKIGTQCWMKENLKTTRYSNGSGISNVTNNSSWENLTSGAYAWFNHNAGYKDIYGAQYNWFATIDARGLCPNGWHVPVKDDWAILKNYVWDTSDFYANELKSSRQDGSPLGGHCNTNEHPRWDANATHNGTDDHGFSGLPAGSRDFNGQFDDLGEKAIWWTATETSNSSAWYYGLNYNKGKVYVVGTSKEYGFSVRCIKD